MGWTRMINNYVLTLGPCARATRVKDKLFNQEVRQLAAQLSKQMEEATKLDGEICGNQKGLGYDVKK